MAADLEMDELSAQQNSAPDITSEEKAGAPQKPRDKTSPIPFLLETSLSFSQIAVISVGVIATVLAILVGSTWTTAVLRGGAASLSIGLLVWTINWIVARGMIQGTLVQVKEPAEVTEAEHKVDKEA